MKLRFSEQSHIYTLDGKRCTSVSSVAKVLEDKFRLQKWEQRMVAVGLASDPDLVERAATHFDDRDLLDTICEEARRAAGAHRAAERGTAIHRITERVDAGETIIRTALADDVVWKWSRVKEATGIEMARDACGFDLCERIVIWPEHNVCGKFDRVGRLPDGRLVVIDLKSGQRAIEYPHSIAIQLALYANAPLIAAPLPKAGGETEEIEDFQAYALDLSTALVIHMPAEGDVEVYEFDIAAGMDAARLCFGALAWRKRSGLCWPLGTKEESDAGERVATAGPEGMQPGSVPGNDESRLDNRDAGYPAGTDDRPAVNPAAPLLAAIEALPADVLAKLKEFWPAGVPGPKLAAQWTGENLDDISIALVRAKDACLYSTPEEQAAWWEKARAEFNERFGRTDERQSVAAAKQVDAVDPVIRESQQSNGHDLGEATRDEGPPADPDAVAALKYTLDQLGNDQKKIIGRWLQEARDAGVPFHSIPNVTVRRYTLARACHALVAHMDGDDELVRLALAFVAGEDAVQPGFPTGAVIGSLGVEEADRLHEVAIGFGGGKFMYMEGELVAAG